MQGRGRASWIAKMSPIAPRRSRASSRGRAAPARDRRPLHAGLPRLRPRRRGRPGGDGRADETAGAFSHYTYEASNRELVVCDACVWKRCQCDRTEARKSPRVDLKAHNGTSSDVRVIYSHARRAGVGYILVAFIIIFYIIPISLTYAVLSVPALEDTDLYRASPWKCAGPSLSAPRARALSRRASRTVA